MSLRTVMFFFGIPIAIGALIGVEAATAYYIFKALTGYKNDSKKVRNSATNSYPDYLK